MFWKQTGVLVVQHGESTKQHPDVPPTWVNNVSYASLGAAVSPMQKQHLLWRLRPRRSPQALATCIVAQLRDRVGGRPCPTRHRQGPTAGGRTPAPPVSSSGRAAPAREPRSGWVT